MKSDADRGLEPKKDTVELYNGTKLLELLKKSQFVTERCGKEDFCSLMSYGFVSFTFWMKIFVIHNRVI